MNALEIMILSAIVGIAALLILRELLGRKLKRENKTLEEKIHRKKEMRKHRAFHVEREVFDPSEETSEMRGIPSSAVQDEEDQNED